MALGGGSLALNLLVPKATLFGRAQNAWRYGINNARLAWQAARSQAINPRAPAFPPISVT